MSAAAGRRCCGGNRIEIPNAKGRADPGNRADTGSAVLGAEQRVCLLCNAGGCLPKRFPDRICVFKPTVRGKRRRDEYGKNFAAFF